MHVIIIIIIITTTTTVSTDLSVSVFGRTKPLLPVTVLSTVESFLVRQLRRHFVECRLCRCQLTSQGLQLHLVL